MLILNSKNIPDPTPKNLQVRKHHDKKHTGEPRSDDNKRRNVEDPSSTENEVEEREKVVYSFSFWE